MKRVLIVLLVGAGLSSADVRLSGVFTDHAVLQRGRPIPIWGWATPGESVSVAFAGQVKSTTTGADGKWMVRLDALPASQESRPLIVRGRNTREVKDVLVGEVWLCSGQSNMALTMAAIESAKAEMAAADDRLLRTFRVPDRPAERPRDDVAGDWISWQPDTAKSFAAMGYYLAKRLRKELGVPVGILMCSWGGSGASAWISAESLAGEPLRVLWPRDVLGWRPNIQPSRLYNGMLFPLAPYAIAGVAWYQGETEGEAYHNPYLYRYLFPALIEDWRRLWARPELPFYWVQLPNLRNKPTWPVVRESQAEALSLPHTGMIPTIDIGQENDLHPKNKQEFADRLAEMVLAREYGKGSPVRFPSFDRLDRTGGELRVSFRDAGQGLRTKDGKPPCEFAVAGGTGQFFDAEARIDGASVMLHSDSVPDPSAVRYAWDGNPHVNLVSAAGLPVLPFRTDTFPVAGEEAYPRDLPRKGDLTSIIPAGDLIMGRSAGWTPSSDASNPVALAKSKLLRGCEGPHCMIAITRGSPVLNWTLTRDFSAARGLTVELNGTCERTGDPLHGVDVEIGYGGRRYRLTVYPMRLYAFDGSEVRILGSDLDNLSGAHRYRIAIRPDGGAQVYLDRELMGILTGEPVTGASRPYIRIGKTFSSGEFVADLDYLAFDPSGAFAPL